jgi:hypothetical protein
LDGYGSQEDCKENPTKNREDSSDDVFTLCGRSHTSSPKHDIMGMKNICAKIYKAKPMIAHLIGLKIILSASKLE